MTQAASPRIEAAAIERLRRVGGRRLLLRMLALFRENAPHRVDAALRGWRVGDLETVRRAMHSLKSTAANLGAARLERLAGDLEAAAELRDTAACATHVASLAQELEATLDALHQLIGTGA